MWLPVETELRNAVQKLRRTPMPLSDMIPLLTKAADEIEELKKENLQLGAQLLPKDE
jgi:hypothetical protein